MRIGLIGYGTIGRAVAGAVREGKAGDAKLVAVLRRDPEQAAESDENWLITADPSVFFAAEMDLVVEAAGHEALRQYAERALLSRCDLLAVSVGALADDGLLDNVTAAARKTGHRLLVPSGALGGLDVISSAAVGRMDEVSITVRKPPAAWKGTAAEDLARQAEAERERPLCLYEGPAREAIRLFPKNVNVLAALSLAGIGFEQTAVKMYADTAVKHNTFDLSARGEFGEVRLELKNMPYTENPKTGRLVVMSVIKSIKRLQENIIVGF
jgi:aspartate dehydrogenase